MRSRFPTVFAMVGLVSAGAAAQSVPVRKDIPSIAKSANGSIVSIVMSDKTGKPLGQGSGFVASTDGSIVTNYHVIAEGVSAVAKFPDGAFYLVDGVVAADKHRDIAIVKAQGHNFRPLKLGNSDRIQVGEEVVAIGNPLSLESTVSNGIVSGIRSIKEEGGDYLQITAPISPGSSGGPLFNMSGEVIGITTMYVKEGENLNFAVPVNAVKVLLRSASSKTTNFPDEHESIEVKQPDRDGHSGSSGFEDYKWPEPVGVGFSARRFYEQDNEAGLFNQDAFGTAPDGSKLSLGRMPNADYVCFNGDARSLEFFTIQAWAYDKDYVAAQEQMTKNQKLSREEFVKQQTTMNAIKEGTPYVSFVPEELAGSMPSGGRLLKRDIYSNGVKTNTLEYHWDGTSWFLFPNLRYLVAFGATPPRNAAAPTSKPRTVYLSLQLYKEDFVMQVLRYAESDADRHVVASGLCQKMTCSPQSASCR
jgi:S1-C subfamily serine protease